VISSRSSISDVDPFSEVMSLLDVRSARCTRLEAGGDWALRFPGLPRIKFVAVLKGACCVILPETPPQQLETGDTFLLSNTPYVIASTPKVAPKDGMSVFDSAGPDIVRIGDGRTAAASC
jgi:hypothetical protein